MKLYYPPGACFTLAPHRAARSRPGFSMPCWPAPRRISCKTARTSTPSTNWATCPCWSWTTAERLREGPAIVQYYRRPGARQEPRTRQRHHGPPPPARVADFHRHRAAQGPQPLFAPRHARRLQAPGARTLLQSRFAWIDKQPAASDYLMGSFSVADAYLYTRLALGPVCGRDTSGLSNPQAFKQRMETRPGVQVALKRRRPDRVTPPATLAVRPELNSISATFAKAALFSWEFHCPRRFT